MAFDKKNIFLLLKKLENIISRNVDIGFEIFFIAPCVTDVVYYLRHFFCCHCVCERGHLSTSNNQNLRDI